MNPKISNFGLARTFGGNEIGANTSRVVGTFGYMSPEYAAEGLFSVKSDVFSFGVLVLEIVSGKRNRGFINKDQLLNLLRHTWMLYKEEMPKEAVDYCLRNSCYLPEIERSIHICLLCVQEHSDDRPDMASVVHMLSNETSLPESKRPGFFTARDHVLTTATSDSDAESREGEFTLSNLKDCEVILKGRLRALFVDKLVNWKVYVGSVMGSVLIEGAEGCVFVLASHQIRIHNA